MIDKEKDMVKKICKTSGYNSIWKSIALISVTTLIAGVGSFFMLVSSQSRFITRAEAEQKHEDILRNAPYPWKADKQYIIDRIDKVEARLLESMHGIKTEVDFIKNNLWIPRSGPVGG